MRNVHDEIDVSVDFWITRKGAKRDRSDIVFVLCIFSSLIGCNLWKLFHMIGSCACIICHNFLLAKVNYR